VTLKSLIDCTLEYTVCSVPAVSRSFFSLELLNWN